MKDPEKVKIQKRFYENSETISKLFYKSVPHIASFNENLNQEPLESKQKVEIYYISSFLPNTLSKFISHARTKYLVFGQGHYLLKTINDYGINEYNAITTKNSSEVCYLAPTGVYGDVKYQDGIKKEPSPLLTPAYVCKDTHINLHQYAKMRYAGCLDFLEKNKKNCQSFLASEERRTPKDFGENLDLLSSLDDNFLVKNFKAGKFKDNPRLESFIIEHFFLK